MTGYSGTPLVQKLGIKKGASIYVKNEPAEYETIVENLPTDVIFHTRLKKGVEFVHIFTKSSTELETFLKKVRAALNPDGMIWVSWPKKASKVPTDIVEDTIRNICLPLDLVDVKVCAVNEVWSGLKLVIRKEKRK